MNYVLLASDVVFAEELFMMGEFYFFSLSVIHLHVCVLCHLSGMFQYIQVLAT